MSADAEHDQSILPQLDWKSQTILQALYELGGTATTTDIRQNTGLETNDDINYRYQRAAVALEPQGLIEVNETPESPQRNPPFEVTLTEQGERLAERLSERSGGSNTLSFEERFEKVEATLDQLEATIDEQATELESEYGTDRTGARVDARFEAIEQRLDRIEEALADNFGAWSAKEQQEYQVMLAGERAVRDFLLEEYEEPFKQYVNERLDEYLDAQETSDDSQR